MDKESFVFYTALNDSYLKIPLKSSSVEGQNHLVYSAIFTRPCDIVRIHGRPMSFGAFKFV